MWNVSNFREALEWRNDFRVLWKILIILKASEEMHSWYEEKSKCYKVFDCYYNRYSIEAREII